MYICISFFDTVKVGKRGNSKVVSVEKTYVDQDTGEMRQYTSRKVVVERIPSPGAFFITFIDFMAPLLNIGQGKDRQVLDEICALAEVNTGYVRFVPEDRDRICKKLGMQRANLSRSVGNLRKAGVIEGSTTYFRIRPELFWKGTTEKRAEVLRERGISVEVSFVIGKDAQKRAIADIKKFEDGQSESEV